MDVSLLTARRSGDPQRLLVEARRRGDPPAPLVVHLGRSSSMKPGDRVEISLEAAMRLEKGWGSR